ncbi:choline/ethanolamine kinase isoform X2 [Ixodes scapularis]|uniref:choline/ethanolamine kinase isoform X2 n=1 Tax=Ixodes scapularis TaxID=6945 RepID=UPI001161963E|nr:choline/ethanolamine kinase isoform X2 [Ixodes scapularis]
MGSFVNFPWESVLKDLARRAKSSLARPGSVVLRRQNCGEPDEVYITEDMRDKAYNICREFLSGTWKSISSSDMVFKSVSGGLSNLLYYCSLPETHTPLYGEPSQVLMRMYGQIHSEGGESTVTESVICTLLSERNLGPKLYGVFPGGRLEEYIPARALTIEQLKDPEISLLIAKKLGKVHVLQAPLVKEPTWLFNNMQRWLKYARSIKVDSLPVKDYTNAVNLLSVDLAAEVGWLRELLSTVCSPIVFCHNDLQEGNILFMEGPGPKEDNMVFIDYEYCAYNYRGFDIGNHFCEWMYDYSYPEHPYFKVLPHDYPRLEHQREFVSHYLRSYKMCQTLKPEDNTPGAINTVEHVLKEAHMFTLASHLMWTLWSIFNAHTSKIKFGYWEYGQARLESYLKLKQQLLTAASEHQQQVDSEATPAATT